MTAHVGGSQNGFAYLNGEIVPLAQARVSVLDRGFLWGDGVYEITPCYGGQLFRLEDHLARLQASLRYVAINLPLSWRQLAQVTREVVELNKAVTSSSPVCRVGHWVSRGVEDWRPVSEWVADPTVSIVVTPDAARSRDDYSQGVLLTVVGTRRNPSWAIEPRVKVLSKMNQILAELDAGSRGAMALMLDADGYIAEGSVSNVFLVRSGQLFTPRVQKILVGITRTVTLELASELGMAVVEEDLTAFDLACAEEIFLTTSPWGILPVRAVDRFTPTAKVPGPVTVRLMDSLAEKTGFHPLTGAAWS